MDFDIRTPLSEERAEKRALIGIARQSRKIRAKFEKSSSQRDFRIGQQKDRFSTQYQKFEESGIDTISDNKEQMANFRKNRKKDLRTIIDK